MEIGKYAKLKRKMSSRCAKPDRSARSTQNPAAVFCHDQFFRASLASEVRSWLSPAVDESQYTGTALKGIEMPEDLSLIGSPQSARSQRLVSQDHPCHAGQVPP